MQWKKKIISDLISGALTSFISTSNSQNTVDGGPAILCALAVDADHDSISELATNTLGVWLNSFSDKITSASSFGGLAGFYVGVKLASAFYPPLIPLSIQVKDSLIHAMKNAGWQTKSVSWEDYDLISGPSGIILAMAIDSDCKVEYIFPAVSHLASLCENDNLEQLRIGAYRDDTKRSWNFNRINTGLAHGVTGIAAALSFACKMDDFANQKFAPTLKILCEWLINESFIDDLGLYTWNPAALEGEIKPIGASQRQAWCYGTPGIAWTLWESGRVLNDDSIMNFAIKAMSTFCRLFQEQFYIDKEPIDSSLGICHGAAGMLVISDAFEVHAGLKEAGELCNRLETYLLKHILEIKSLAQENMTILTGTSGILSALLTRHGSNRQWLAQLALR